MPDPTREEAKARAEALRLGWIERHHAQHGLLEQLGAPDWQGSRGGCDGPDPLQSMSFRLKLARWSIQFSRCFGSSAPGSGSDNAILALSVIACRCAAMGAMYFIQAVGRRFRRRPNSHRSHRAGPVWA
jgi:hypothetical protein